MCHCRLCINYLNAAIKLSVVIIISHLTTLICGSCVCVTVHTMMQSLCFLLIYIFSKCLQATK